MPDDATGDPVPQFVVLSVIDGSQQLYGRIRAPTPRDAVRRLRELKNEAGGDPHAERFEAYRVADVHDVEADDL